MSCFSPHLCVGFLFLVLHSRLRPLLLLLPPPPPTTCPHTTCPHTCPHTTCSHTHNLSTHNLSSHNLSTHNFLTRNLSTHNLSTFTTCPHTTCPPSLCVAGVALGDSHLQFAWEAWHLWHGRRGTWRHGPPLCVAFFARQAWHLVTSTFTLRGRRGIWRHPPALCVAGVALGDIPPSLCVAGVALMALGWLWSRAWFPDDAVDAAAFCVARRGTWLHPPSLYVAGAAFGDIHLHFAWQAWHLVTSTFTLRGRRGRGADGAGLALLARLVPR